MGFHPVNFRLFFLELGRGTRQTDGHTDRHRPLFYGRCPLPTVDRRHNNVSFTKFINTGGIGDGDYGCRALFRVTV